MHRGTVEQLRKIESSWSDPAIDLGGLLARVEYDRELLRDLLTVFRHEFPPIYLQLQDAARRGDKAQVQINAHTLKGMLASLSFVRATDLAIRIERMSREATLDSSAMELASLEREAVGAQQSLEQICRGGAS